MNTPDKLLGFISIGMKAGAYTLGSELTQAAARTGKIRLILLSCDASGNTKKLVRNLAHTHNIHVIEHYPMDKLGNACGKQKLSVIGVKNEKIALQIQNLYGQTVEGGNA